MQMKTEKQQSVYIVYPTALFDGWEVVKEPDETPIFFATREAATHYAQGQATADGVAVVKFENWFGDTERIWSVPPRASLCQDSSARASDTALQA
jgi:hypothetical protein